MQLISHYQLLKVYKVSVDLKDGITISDGNPATVTPNGSGNFTLRYTLQ